MYLLFLQCSEEGCPKKFSSKTALKYHLKHYHQLGGKEASGKVKEETPSRSAASADAVRGKFLCTHAGCSKSYNVRSYLVPFFADELEGALAP